MFREREILKSQRISDVSREGAVCFHRPPNKHKALTASADMLKQKSAASFSFHDIERNTDTALYMESID
jgi:hypothetical protein